MRSNGSPDVPGGGWQVAAADGSGQGANVEKGTGPLAVGTDGDQLPLLGKWGSMTSPGRSEVGLGCKVTEGGKRGGGGEDETAKVYDESRRPRTGMRRSHCATAKTGTGKESHCAIMTTKTGGGDRTVRSRRLMKVALRDNKN